MVRFFFISGILLKYLFLFLLIKLHLYKITNESFVKKFFEDAGGSFIKFGQLLALRVDVLPKEYALTLLDLFDNVRPFPIHFINEIFIRELGALPGKIFKDFQKEPFASASFGQVHAAKLADDTIVAVKILRPGIEEDIQVDFIFISILAFFADFFFTIEAMPWREFAQEFKKWTLRELDYHIEVENLEKLSRSDASTHPNIVFPKIFKRFSTKRILVQEYLDGIPLSRVIRGLRDGRLTPESLKKMGIDLTIPPKLLVQEMMRQYFYTGYFHADPHPGNIILLKNNRIGLIDFGIVGQAAPNQKAFLKLLDAGSHFRFQEASYYLIQFAGMELRQMVDSAFPASVDEEKIETLMQKLAEEFAASVDGKIQTGIKDLESMKTDYAVLSLQVLKAAQSYKIKLPKEMVVFTRALSIIGLMAKELDYSFRLTNEIKSFLTLNKNGAFFETADSGYQRISRDRALEKLNSWLSYLVEKDPRMYQLVNKYMSKYNIVGI